MKAKFKLDVWEYADYDFLLFGLNCSEEELRLCWLLNKSLGLDFLKQPSIETQNNKLGEQNSFPLFEYVKKPIECDYPENPDELEQLDKAEELDVIYQLVGNRNPNGVLIPEQPRVDYFLIVRGEYHDQVNPDAILHSLKQIPKMHMAFSLQPQSLKSKENLIF
jgi:hypothetical protein